MNDSLADSREYLAMRAEAELDLAQSATHPAAVKAHYVLAGYYLDRLYGPPSNDGEGEGPQEARVDPFASTGGGSEASASPA